MARSEQVAKVHVFPASMAQRRFCRMGWKFEPHKLESECPHMSGECDLGTIKKSRHREIRRIIKEAAWRYTGQKFADCELMEKALVVANALVDPDCFGFRVMEHTTIKEDRCADRAYDSPLRLATDVELLWLFSGVLKAMGAEFDGKISYQTLHLQIGERSPFSFENGKIRFLA